MKIFFKIIVLISFVLILSIKKDAVVNSTNDNIIVTTYHGSISRVSFPKSRRNIDIGSYWFFGPDIRVCKMSGARDIRVRQAVDFWKRLGYQFGNVIYDSNCHTEPKPREITITLVTNNIHIGSNLAVTRTSSYRSTKEILKSVIYVMPFTANKELVLEHEIGHALGWNHRGTAYHLMNPNYRKIGHNTSGLSHREYTEQISRLRLYLSHDEN
jgi:hypothetical protein